MKKRIMLEGEAVAALNTIVSSASFNSRADGRKVHTVAKFLQEPLNQYRAAYTAVQDQYAIPKPAEEGKPAPTKNEMIIPEERVAEYKAAIQKVNEEKLEVIMDIESFTCLIAIVDGVFERKEILEQNGLSGLDQARNMEQISLAFETVQNVD